MAEALTREGLRLNRAHAPHGSSGSPHAHDQPRAGHYADKGGGPRDEATLPAPAQTETVVVQSNLGNFRRQQGKLVVKAFVRPEAYAGALRQKARGSEAATPFPDDPAWLYKARWVTSLPFMFAHQSISRSATALA